MFRRNSKWTKIFCFVIVMSIVVFGIYLFLTSKIFDQLSIRLVYGQTYPLDGEGRCLVVETNKKNVREENKNLHFYDTERETFVHLDITRIITKVEEIRPGYYALYDRHGMQIFTLIMPYASDNPEVRMNDEIQTIDCTPDEWYRNLETMDCPKLPSNIKEAEALFIKQYKETGQCGDELIDYVREHRETLDYGFDGIKKETEISILTSPDKRLRFYTWDTGRGGTSPDFVAYVQFNDGESVAVRQFTPLSASMYVTKGEVKMDGYVPYDGTWIDCLYQIDQPDDSPIYITSAYNRASSQEGGQEAFALKIVNGKLQKIPFIDKYGQEKNSAGCIYNIPDWYFKTDGLGWDWIPNFDNDMMTLYIPEDGDMDMSDRYDKYQYADGKMRHVGNGAGFWLHPSLHDFKRLCGIYQTKTKFIRVDLLADGNYRYAAWAKKEAMSGTPELVIIGGKTDIMDNAIVFEKDGYEYIVPAYRQGSGEDFGKFIIKRNGKIMQQVEV